MTLHLHHADQGDAERANEARTLALALHEAGWYLDPIATMLEKAGYLDTAEGRCEPDQAVTRLHEIAPEILSYYSGVGQPAPISRWLRDDAPAAPCRGS